MSLCAGYCLCRSTIVDSVLEVSSRVTDSPADARFAPGVSPLDGVYPWPIGVLDDGDLVKVHPPMG